MHYKCDVECDHLCDLIFLTIMETNIIEQIVYPVPTWVSVQTFAEEEPNA